MSSPNNKQSSPPAGDGSVLGADDKPRLTEVEKKQNHIASGRLGLYRLAQLQMLSVLETTYEVAVLTR